MGLISFVLKWAFLIFIAIVLIIAGAFVYFYYFHTFQTIRICAPEKTIDTNNTCSSNQECVNFFKSNVKEISSMEDKLDSAPEKIRILQESLINGIFVCNKTCRARNIDKSAVRGIEIFSKAPPCNLGEVELAKVDIKGKDVWPIINYMRQNPSMFG